jgi:hypothetical protein
MTGWVVGLWWGISASLGAEPPPGAGLDEAPATVPGATAEADDDALTPWSVCEIPARTCSRYHLGMTLVDVGAATAFLLGFDTWPAQGPPERTFGELEQIETKLYLLVNPVIDPPTPALAPALEIATRMMDTLRAVDTDAAMGRATLDLDERRARFDTIACVVSTLLDDLDALEREVAAHAPNLAGNFRFRNVVQGLEEVRPALMWLVAVVEMQADACAASP